VSLSDILIMNAARLVGVFGVTRKVEIEGNEGEEQRMENSRVFAYNPSGL
jgi:hypothetical protein